MDKKAHILVVDDDPEFVDLINLKLNECGYKVTSTIKSKEALSLALRVKPDVVLLDVKMPDRDGIQVAYDFHNNNQTKNIDIIFFTSLGDNNPTVREINRRLSKELGVVDYLKKDTDMDVLTNTIDEIMEKNAKNA